MKGEGEMAIYQDREIKNGTCREEGWREGMKKTRIEQTPALNSPPEKIRGESSSSHTPSVEIAQVNGRIINTHKRRRILKQLPRPYRIRANDSAPMLKTQPTRHAIRIIRISTRQARRRNGRLLRSRCTDSRERRRRGGRSRRRRRR